MRLTIMRMVFLLSLVGCASSPPVSTSQPPTAFEYRIGAGDKLEIFVWQYPELTRQVTVRPDGNLSFPLIGEIYVVGLKPPELEEKLVKKLSEFLRSPVVTVSVIEASSFSVLIRGGVNKPGQYPYWKGMTLLHLITQAGDFSLYADKDDITIIRGEGNEKKTMKVKLKTDSEYEPTYLEPGDIVIVGD